ncbi:InlB B-repeat-containing protein [uncultured Slackia sp.]|uniref:InlB B-repeat-containing protein n=1 Tax=uncultured Slackia sp. TaxID=665903 RepID=UPI0025EBE684|nr:InlB B-repeat-containing protein [uncultured Slackia sp.]
MRFGPLFARGEMLATRRNATDGTPPSGVAKNDSHQYTKALWQRVVAVFVAVSMATSLTPSAAFANENAEGATANQPALSASSDAVSGDADASDSQAGTDHASAEQGADAAGAAGAAGDASAVAGTFADEAPSGDLSNAEEVNSEAPASVAAVSSDQGDANAVAAASAATLSSEAKVFIQDAKDKDNSYSSQWKSGALNAGDTLWANMYDEVETEDYWGDPTTETKSVANPGTWTYTWLAGTVRASDNVADYTDVVGYEQSLTVTAAMGGKYFICKVTADGKDYYGPSVSYGSGINANYIPGPVLGAGQMELYSVKLNSDTPSIGDTLTATPYKDWSSPAGSDAKVTYTWFASTSSSSGFTKIEGETGATLTVTDNLEGKYIKVEATAGVNTVTKTTSSKVKQAGAVEISAVSIVNTKDNTSVFAVGDTAKARAKEKGGAYGAFVDTSKLNYQWQCSDTKNGAYTDIAGATGETLELTDALGGKYLKCKVSSKIGSSSLTNSTGALVAASGSINVTSVTMSPSSGKVEVGSTITATAKAGSADVTSDSHVTWQWYKGTSSYASSCNTPIEGETSNTLTVTAALKGCYVVAKANGGYGEQRPSSYYAAGPVSVAGQVELYDVQFEGSPATNGVRVGDTLKTKVRKKDGSSYSYIGRTDNVTYQWQYANSSSSDDPAYTDIPGATEATYTVDAAYAGKYLRVKVTSENTISSTQKMSSYGTQSVAPLGPVTLKGQYKLAGIELADKNVTLNVGSKITPSVQVPGSWSGSTKDVPDDAELTMAWYASENGTDWTELTDGIDTTDGSLTISDALVGKKIKVTASALDNTVEWVSSDSVTAAGEYNLLRVIANPQINSDSTHLVSGDSVKATVQAKRADGSTTNGIDVTAQTTVVWYAAEDAKAPAADWTLLSDMSGAEAVVSASAAGKYLKAVATSGSSTVELVSANKVIAAGSLEAAVQKLTDSNKQIVVDYSAKGGNVNDALKAQLADLGFTDIDVKVSEGGVLFKAEDAKASVGISDAQDKTNGDVTFFYIDPNDYTGYNIDGLRSADVVFELSRDGKTEYYQPNKTVQVAWDEARVQQMLDDAAEQIAIGYAAGDSAESVTSNLTLPYRAGSKSKFEVSWKSSDGDVIWPSGYGWSDYTGKVTRLSSDRDIMLTATVSFVSGGPSDVKGTRDFTVTVKGDPEKVAADKKALQEKVDAAFTYDNIKYSGTDTVADKDGLTADLQMPRTSTLNIDGKYYEVKYSASTDDITFNGYKGTVYQPLPGAKAANTKITLTVTDKSNAEVTASKALDFAIAPQDQNELNTELLHLSLAKLSFYQAILDGQDVSNVTGNLHAPLKVYGQGHAVNWCYTTEEAAGHYGFVFSELPGGTENTYRLLKSSKPSVISHENLLLTQPEYNTEVTISGCLKSERFARYAERYPENEDYAALAGMDVSATVTVKGTTGLDNPNEGKTITVTAKVTGVSASDADGNYTEQSVVPLTELTLPADEDTTAESVLEQLMTTAGCTDLETNAWGLTSATMPDGRVLSTTSTEPYSYWSFFVNNGYASVGAPSYYLKNDDCVEFRYVKGDGTQKPSTAPATNPGTEHPDVDAPWNGFANGGAGSATDALTPTAKTDTPSWALNLLTEEQQKAGASVSASDPIVANGKVYLITGASVWGGKTWNAVLNEIDPATGSVVRSLELGSSMDSTCRPVVAQGIILIPLSGGYLQAVSTTTLETLWYSDAFTKQNLSSLTVDGDYVYINTLDYWSDNDVQNGTVKRINIRTGAVAGSASVTDGGYYWSGGLMVNGYYVVGGDFGQVRVYSADLSKLVGSIKLSGGNIRSALTVHDGYIYAVTRDDGTLHRLAIGSDGSLTEAAAVQFAAYSTSTPVFSGNYAFIGGATANNWNAKGLLSIVDLSDMSVKQISKADGEELGFESKSTPLVSTHDGETYVYFTLNGAKGNWPNYTSGGGVYMYKLGDAEATEVFVPGSGYANYCMASVVCDRFGNLYYTNDSGHLFCVKSQAHRVKFDSQGGSSVGNQTPASGSTVTKPADPTREGYAFGGWYTDAACTKAYDFATAVTSDMTLYAKWTKNETSSSGSSSGSDNADDGEKDNTGTQAASQGGSVAPSSLPLSQSALSKSDDEKANDGKKADDQKGAKASDAKSSSKAENDGAIESAAAADDGASSTESAPIWPYIVLAVGVAGLAAAIVWFVVARRKRDGDE